jgi:hypothetical protein
MAIVGDFMNVKDNPLKDFIYESNRLVQQPGWLLNKSCGFARRKPCKTTFLTEVVWKLEVFKQF